MLDFLANTKLTVRAKVNVEMLYVERIGAASVRDA